MWKLFRQSWDAFRHIKAFRDLWEALELLGFLKLGTGLLVGVAASLWAWVQQAPPWSIPLIGLICATAMMVLLAFGIRAWKDLKLHKEAEAPPARIETSYRPPIWVLTMVSAVLFLSIVGFLALKSRTGYVSQLDAEAAPETASNHATRGSKDSPLVVPQKEIQRALDTKTPVPVTNPAAPPIPRSPASIAPQNISSQHGSAVGTINVQPGSISSVGQQGGITAGQVIVVQSPKEEPRVANIRIATQNVIASTQPDFPWALEVVVQTDQPIEPVSFAFICDGAVGRVDGGIRGSSTMTEYKFGTAADHPNVALVQWATPRFTAVSPMVITIWSKEKIRVVDFKHILRSF